MTQRKAEASAKGLLAGAVEHEGRCKHAVDAKVAAADAARAKCADLVARAAAGAEVDAAALMQAQDEVRAAEVGFDIAWAIHQGAVRRRHESEIAVWFQQADEMKKAVEQSLDERCAAAAVVDACLAELDRAVARFNAAGLGFSNARIAASGFTADREARIAANPVLAAMPAGTHPHAKHYHGAEIRQVMGAIFDVKGGLERQCAIQSLAQREAFLWGRKPAAGQ